MEHLITIRNDYGDCAGPELLAEALISVRHQMPFYSETSKRLSDAGLAKIIRVAFYLSLTKHEGNHPRLRFIDNSAGRGYVVRFHERVQLDFDPVKQLRRLAPVCSQPDLALCIAEDGASLFCTGIVDVSMPGYFIQVGDPRFLPHGSSDALHVAISGPGHLIASEGISYELRAGAIRFRSRLGKVPAIKQLFDEVADGLAATVTNSELFEGPASVFRLNLNFAWERTVSQVVRMRRGGTLLLLPDQSQNLQAIGLRCPRDHHTAELSMTNGFAALWMLAMRAHHAQTKDDFLKATGGWDFTAARLLRAADAVAGLTCADGCVVLDRSLNVRGFGAKIDVDDAMAERSAVPFRDAAGNVVSYDDYMAQMGGTRHASACRFCKAHRGAIVFVISQDGELSVFYSDGSGAYKYSPLDPTGSGVAFE